ncbi:hypothetical protein Dda_8554 [Drechslerella dactyloides]|uniref:Spindle pole body component n=1 Tax=Drechslerella dactyloides TaxID=74499 RepID=A0AAD6NHD9_DREDA|nr:hypothetical protein Dda_8554 [Drechslerella dactyloides]
MPIMSRPEVTALTSALVTAATGIPASSSNHNLSLTYALKAFRTYRAVATDPFAIRQALEGLEEKFRVRDKESLADELRSRLHTLDAAVADAKLAATTAGDSELHKYAPDVLRLLLELSEQPVENAEASLDELVAIDQARQEEQEARARQLAEEEAAARAQDLADGEADIWLVPDFAADSSDDDGDWAADEFTRQADIRERKKAAKRKAQTQAENEDKLNEQASPTLDDYIRIAHAAAAQGIELAQYWSRQTILPVEIARDFVSYGYTAAEISELWLLGELHVIREVIFALYGLPSSLFRFQDDGSINVIAKYVVENTSPGSLNDILDHFAGKAVILQKLRTFSKWLERRCEAAKASPTTHDAVAPAQSFVEAIQNALHEWELESLVPTEEQYVRHSRTRKQDVMVSLLQLQRELDPSLDKFTPLYEIVIALERGLAPGGLTEPAARVSFHLELLFKKTCEAESNGRGEIFRFLRGIFLPCLRTYLRPIAKWMELGELREADGLGAFFVHPADDDDDDEDGGGGDDAETARLARLWHGQYVLDRDERDTIVAPSFIRECGRKIFVTGKSVLFLHKLGDDMARDSGLDAALSSLSDTTKATMDININTTITTTNANTASGGRSLVSFNDALLVALAEWVDGTHRAVSSRLRDMLYYDCGLWDSLEALVDVYFMRDGFAMTSFCSTLFERMDRGHGRWDDRFLLTELLQSVYSENGTVDIARLAVRNTGNTGSPTVKETGVKVLAGLAAEYRLSWPVMNVVTAESVGVCRRVWGFLLMIRRSRAALERMRVGGAGRNRTGDSDKLVCMVRWRLLTFIGLLQAFLVDLVLRPQVEGLKGRLAEAEDLDEMIDAQEEHFSRIEDLCLLSAKLAPLYQAVVSVLELAVTVAAVGETGSASGKRSGYAIGIGYGGNDARNVNVSFSGSTAWRRATAQSDDDSEEEQDGHDDEEGGDGGSDGEGRSLNGNARERERRVVVGRLAGQVQRLVEFLTTGLRSMARAGVYPDTIEVLAERLEMGALEEEDLDLS